MATEPVRTYPSELPVLALRQTVVFPLTLQPLAINRPASIDSVNRALSSDRLLFLSLQTGDAEDADPAALNRVGTIGAIRQMAKAPNGGIHVIAEGLRRARAEVFNKSHVSLNALVAPLPESARRRHRRPAPARVSPLESAGHQGRREAADSGTGATDREAPGRRRGAHA
jgi:ATP-dependent Lon protease